MAALEQSDLSLMSLEDELTCSICLSPFDCPVTIPCGHNFCQRCLLDSWTEIYRCPQCRTLFHTKPELKKNTVLSAVVQTLNLRLVGQVAEEKEAEQEAEEAAGEDAVIRCDTCMEAEAANTCLTCMASFCDEHLRPHRENPVFRPHQLIEPVGDLSERVCPDHHKLMELFCSQHVRPICSFCLQQDHKGCSFTSPEEQRKLKESEFTNMLALLDRKIKTTENVLSEMSKKQNKLKNAADKKKKALAAVYLQIQEMLAQEERMAQNSVERELETGQTKLQNLMKKFTNNTAKMREAREEISCQLSRSQTMSFLQASFDLPQVVKFEPHEPRISLDSKEVTLNETFARTLKTHLTEILQQPLEARLPIMKPVSPAPPKSQTSLFQSYVAPPFNYMNSVSGWSSSPLAYGASPGFNWATQNQTQRTRRNRKPQSTTGKRMQAHSMENLLDLDFSTAPQPSQKADGGKPDVV